MSKVKRKQRGGWPKRDRAALSLRVEPAVAEWFGVAAQKAGRSGNAMIEAWVSILPAIMNEIEADFVDVALPEIWQSLGLGAGKPDVSVRAWACDVEKKVGVLVLLHLAKHG